MLLRSCALVPTLLLTAVVVVPLAAADMEVNDLRFGAGMLSNDFRGGATHSATNTDNSVDISTSSEDGRNSDRNLRGQIQYLNGSLGTGGGFIWGVGLAMNRASWTNDGLDATVVTPTVDILLGYGYAVTPNWHLELTPFAGYGRAYYSVSEHGSIDTTQEWDNYVEFGAKIGTYAALAQHLVLGIEIPYLMGRFDPEYSYTDETKRRVTVADKRTNQGFGAVASIGYRF